MPRSRGKPDVFQLTVATRSYSSVDGYRKEIDVLKSELAQTRQRLDDQARDFAREREDLQRQLRVKKGAPASPERVVVKKDDTKWEARCAELTASNEEFAAELDAALTACADGFTAPCFWPRDDVPCDPACDAAVQAVKKTKKTVARGRRGCCWHWAGSVAVCGGVVG